MRKLDREQEKALLKTVRFFSGQFPNRVRGKAIGWAEDDFKRFGAVVVFPNQKWRSFYVVNPVTMQVECVGEAPPPKR